MTENNKSYPELKGLKRHNVGCIVTGTSVVNPQHASPSGLCAVCLKEGMCEIGKKAKTGRTVFPEPFGVAQFSPEKRLPFLSDIQILPQITGKEVIFRNVKTDANIGGFKCSAPLAIAAMGSTIVAHKHGKDLAAGAAKAGIPMTVGENVYITYGKKGLKDRIKPYLDNYHRRGAVGVQVNANEFKLNVGKIGVELGAQYVELKLGQGCKMGLGGEIKFKSAKDAEKYKKMGITVVKGKECYERHCSPGGISEESLKKMILKHKSLRIPIWIKIAAGRGIVDTLKYFQKIKKKEHVNIKCVTIDGYGGSTGMSPWLIMNEVGVPSWTIFNAINKKKFDFDIMLTGGFTNGIEVGKGMMLGADAIAMGRTFLIAANVKKAKGIENYVKSVKEELQMLCATQRLDKVKELKDRRENLFAISKEAADLFGLKTNVKKLL